MLGGRDPQRPDWVEVILGPRETAPPVATRDNPTRLRGIHVFEDGGYGNRGGFIEVLSAESDGIATAKKSGVRS